MSLTDYLQFAFAFGFVLALIALAALAARRFGLGHGSPADGRRRLSVSEAATIDPRHKLVLVRRDDVEHLLVLGPGGATPLETGIVSADEPVALRAGGAAERPAVSAFTAMLAGAGR